MNPYIMRIMAAEHNCDLRRQAAVERRARLGRRVRWSGLAGLRSGV